MLTVALLIFGFRMWCNRNLTVCSGICVGLVASISLVGGFMGFCSVVPTCTSYSGANSLLFRVLSDHKGLFLGSVEFH